jgi:hypothetical protein
MQIPTQVLTPPVLDIVHASAVPNPIALSSALQVGANARSMFETAKMTRVPRHPPTRAAFLPGLRDAILLFAVVVLSGSASRSLKAATGIPVFRQTADMLSLWYKHGIDPPSYFEVEMWRPENLEKAAAFLTRYETKNGVFHTLNNWRPKPHAANEMGDKKLFADICRQNNLPHAKTLLHVSRRGIEWHCQGSELQTDLFVKWREGMGAEKTMKIEYCGNGTYLVPDGRRLNLDHLLTLLLQRGRKADILVQKHLQNHTGIAALADQSLLTMRVITCLNENAEPEVTLAMLRLLTKLEPQWKKYAKDMEYANPVNLATGTLGRCTGDSVYTSHLRYDRHPVTFENMLGKQVPYWRETQDLALAAHRAFNHRMTVGWDIAITPEGPVLLEGNTNYDVMFLQRVHDQPIGHSRLGELLNHHILRYMAEQGAR